MSRQRLTAVAVLTAATALAPGDARAGWDSRWRAEPLSGDGTVSSWDGVETKSDADVDVGATNDGEFLWVRLLPEDGRAQMALLGGLTLWVGEEGDDARFGVRIAPERPDEMPRPRRDGERPEPGEIAETLREALKSVSILNSAGMTERVVAVPAERGIDVRVDATPRAALVVRIPLRGSGETRFLDAGPGDEIRLAVVGERRERLGDGTGPPPGGAPPGGGFGGGSAGRGPGGGGMRGPGGMRGGPPEPIDFHARLKLAKASDG